MQRILDLLFPPREDERIVRALTEDAFLALLAPRLVPSTTPETVSLLPLSDARVRSAIHEAKYRGNEAAFALLGAALAAYLEDSDELGHDFALVPVPLGPARRRERGYNQVEEIIKRSGMPFDAPALERTRETESQVSLSGDARRTNMKDAFRATGTLSTTRTYVLIDDVTTTGATIEAALQALRAGGAVRLMPLALAH